MKKFALISLFITLSLTAAPYAAKDYSHLLGMPGFGDETLKNHFKLYQGYVKNTNLLISILSEGGLQEPEFGALQRRLGWEWDGMRLHEFYFDNLGGNGKSDMKSEIYKAIQKQFGSYNAWREGFEATGLMRGIGWVILYQDPKTGKLFNVWINEHATNHLAGGTPLLIMDVWEHAYLLDYGLDRAAYIKAFFNNIDWDVVNKRYKEANPSSS